MSRLCYQSISACDKAPFVTDSANVIERPLCPFEAVPEVIGVPAAIGKWICVVVGQCTT